MADRLATLEIAVLGRISDFVSKMGTVDKTVDAFQVKTAALGRNMTQMGASMALIGAAVAVPMGLAARAVVKTGATFEQTMRNVQSVLGQTGAQGQQTYETLSKFAEKMGRTTVFRATEAADALYFLASAGYNAGRQMQALKPILDLAAATQADLASSSELVVSMLNAFQLPATEAARMANVFAAGISKSQLTMGRLGVSLPYVAAAAKNLNISLEETVATLGVLVSSGQRAEAAGAKLRTGLLTLAKVTGGGKKALKEMGLTARDVDPAINNLTQIVGKLAEAGMTAAQASALFGKRTSDVWLTLVGAGAESVAELERQITDTNAAAEMAGIQLDTVAGATKLLKSAIEGIEIIIFKAMRDDIKTLVDVLGVVARALGNFAEKHGTLIKWAARLTVVLGGTTAAVLLGGGMFLIFGGQILMTVSNMKTFKLWATILNTHLKAMTVNLIVIIGLLAAFAIGMEIGDRINDWERFRTVIQRLMASLMLIYDLPTQIQALYNKQARERIEAYWKIATGEDPVTGEPFAARTVANVSLVDKAVSEIENMFYRSAEAADTAAANMNKTADAIKHVSDTAAAIPETIMPGGFGALPAPPTAPAIAVGRQTQELANLIAERDRLMGSYATERDFLFAISDGQIKLSASENIRYGQLRRLIAEKQAAIDYEMEQEAAIRRAILERRGMEQGLYEMTLAQRELLLESYGSEREFLENATLEDLERFNSLEERLIAYQAKLADNTPWATWIANAQRASSITKIGIDTLTNVVNSLSRAVGSGIVKAFDKAENAVMSFFGRLIADLAAAIVKALMLKMILSMIGMPGGAPVPGFGALLMGGGGFQAARPDFWARYEGGRILDLFAQGMERNTRAAPATTTGELGEDNLADQPFTFAPNIVIEDPSPMTKVRVYDEWFADRAEELEEMTTEAD